MKTSPRRQVRRAPDPLRLWSEDLESAYTRIDQRCLESMTREECGRALHELAALQLTLQTAEATLIRTLLSDAAAGHPHFRATTGE